MIPEYFYVKKLFLRRQGLHSEQLDGKKDVRKRVDKREKG